MNKIFVEVTGERATKIFFYNESQSKVAAIASEINGIPWHNKLWQHLARSHFGWFVCCWEYFFFIWLVIGAAMLLSNIFKWFEMGNVFVFFFFFGSRTHVARENAAVSKQGKRRRQKKVTIDWTIVVCHLWNFFFLSLRQF